jgi:hypothetical protein
MTLPPSSPASARRRARRRGTILLVLACVLVAAAAITTAVLLPGYARDGVRRDAQDTLRAFLEDAAALDGHWHDSASPLLQGVVPTGAPLRGERETADALKLKTSFEIGEPTFSGADLAHSDTASATVRIRYRYTILGEKGTASIPQTVWLTRPFYYGDRTPQRASAHRQPTAVGPWRVTGITGPARQLPSSLGLASDQRDADGLACYTPLSALTQLADSARIDGVLASSCFLGADDGSDALEKGLDTAALLAAFPAIDRTDPASIPPEVMRLDTGDSGPRLAPFTEFLVSGRYLVTFAAVTTGGDRQATRIVSIRDIEGPK